MAADDRAKLQLRNNIMALKKMHPEIMMWQIRLLEQCRHPEILALFAGLVDFRKAASRWLNKAIAAADKDYDDPNGPVRTWFKTQKPTPYEVIRDLLPKPKPPEPPKKREPPPAKKEPVVKAAEPTPPPAPAPVEEPKAEEAPKKAPRKRKVKPA